MKDWTYNEFDQVGVDYSKENSGAIYDEQMTTFRNYQEEAKELVGKLGLENTNNLTAVDIGCGTGAFSVFAAKYFKKMIAVDVSKEMLKIANTTAEKEDVTNIEFVNSGFLNFDPKGQVDVVFSKWAFHHLPDFWKQAALLNINKMLKPNGVFFLADVVFKFDTDYENNLEAMLAEMSKDLRSDFVEETKTHIREEYSTFDWVLEGMFERAGFKIEHANTDDMILSEYLCRKVGGC